MTKQNPYEQRHEILEEERALERLQKGHPELVLVKKSDAEIPFFSELSVERFCPFLPNNFRGNSITISRVYKDRVGKRFLQTATVGKLPDEPKELGVLKIKHQNFLYSIMKIWADQDWKVMQIENDYYGVIDTTRYNLLKYAMKPGAAFSKPRYNQVLMNLHEMKSCPFTLIESPLDETEEVTVEEPRGKKKGRVPGTREAVFYLLADFEYEKDGTSIKAGGNIRIILSKYITKKFYKKEVTLIRLDVFMSFRTDIAKIVYPLCDRILPHIKNYKKALKNLCEETGLHYYQKEAQNKHKWATALKELHGAELSCGKRMAADIVKEKRSWFFKAWLLEEETTRELLPK